jgi:hypothetical protein
MTGNFFSACGTGRGSPWPFAQEACDARKSPAFDPPDRFPPKQDHVFQQQLLIAE